MQSSVTHIPVHTGCQKKCDSFPGKATPPETKKSPKGAPSRRFLTYERIPLSAVIQILLTLQEFPVLIVFNIGFSAGGINNNLIEFDGDKQKIADEFNWV